MELIQFIRNNNITNYETLKTVLEAEPYNLKFKEDIEYPNLFLIHPQDNSAFQYKIVNECNGIIMEKGTLKIVCYTFNKCYDTATISENIDINNLYVEKSIEGTLIRLFYYNDKWMVSTKRCIDASKSRWLSEKNFLQLFQECVSKYNFMDNLNTIYCYSFIVMHPENKNIINYTTANICHISTRDLNTLIETNASIGLPQNERIYVNDINNILNNMNQDYTLSNEGYIFIDTQYNRWKIKTPHFKKVRDLWGQTNNRFYRYVELRKDYNLLNEYLIYYNNDRGNFIEYEDKIKNLAYEILKIYMSKHIDKNNINIPFYFSKIIYNLHGDYFKDKIKTDYNKIMLKLLDIEPKSLCYMMNNYDKNRKEINADMVHEMT